MHLIRLSECSWHSSHAEPDRDQESAQAVVLPAAKASSSTTPAATAATAIAANVTPSPSAAEPAAKVHLYLTTACQANMLLGIRD